MPLVDRCDEIVRLIDDALGDLARNAGPAQTVGPSASFVRDRDESTPVHRAADGRWWQRRGAPDPSGIGHAAA